VKRSSQTNRLFAAFLLFCGAVIVSCLTAEAEEATKRIPFGYAKDAAPVEAPVANSSLDRIEFRGVMATGSETLVVLFDRTSSRSTVLKLNELVDNLKVTEYQPENERVRVESGADWKWIELLQAKVVAAALPPPKPVAPGGPQPPVPQANGAPPAGGMAQVSDEEVRDRMQRVAEEIRRRRALRRQALQDAQQTQPSN
jgi:hypothetical protein